ncbi:MAG: FISUMP domain-containing protein [Candidatus Saccharibacteria bacterium]|nr:FISUMP domain-containing protein [Candidatus Saccharibacteria bacterium]
MKNNKQYIIYRKYLSSLFFMASFISILFILVTFFPIACKGEQTAEAADGTAQGSSLTLDVVTGTASADLSSFTSEQLANLDTGILIKSSDINFSVTTNHYSGYKLFIGADDDSGFLSSDNYNISSISSSLTEAQFNNIQHNNLWGIKVNDGNYFPSPTITTTTIDNKTNAGAYNYALAFAARITHEVPIGAYLKELTLSAIINPTPYIITYDKNTTDDVSNMPEAQNGATTETSIILSTTRPARNGYVFVGWCPVAVKAENREICPNNESFGAGSIFGISQTGQNSLTFYAMWAEPDSVMQDATIEKCHSYAKDNLWYLYDERDGKQYTARYINGYDGTSECWMTRNLAYDMKKLNTLEPSTTNVQSAIKFEDTDFNIDKLRISAPTADNLTKTGLSAEENGYWYNYGAATAGEKVGTYFQGDPTRDICPAGWRLPSRGQWGSIASGDSGGWNSTYVDIFAPVLAGSTDNNGSLSNYAGTHGIWWSSSIASHNTVYTNYFYPKWGLRSEQIEFVRAGFSIRCILKEVPKSATIEFNGNDSTSGAMENQILVDGEYLKGNSFNKLGYIFTGWNTRADGGGISYVDGAPYFISDAENGHTITLYAQWRRAYMQEYTSSWCQSEANSSSITIKDRRDNKPYAVRYINGNCWMVQNLAYDPDILEPGTSNVTEVRSPYYNSFSDVSIPTYGISWEALMATPSEVDSSTAEYLPGSSGYWYNYCAATAGTWCPEGSYDSAGMEIAEDICPAGWNIPSRMDWYKLTGTNGIASSAHINAFSPIAAGSWSVNYHPDGDRYGLNLSHGKWWSSSTKDKFNAYTLLYDASHNTLSSDDYGDSSIVGNSIRCILSR